MTTIPSSLEALLTRTNAAAALTEAGFPVSQATLSTKATRGGGPPYQKFGPRPLYRWGDALAWAQSRLSTPRHTTSDAQGHVWPAQDHDGRLYDRRQATVGHPRRRVPRATARVCELGSLGDDEGESK
jgi:hypothetical protein